MTQELGADDLWGLKGNQSSIPERAQRRLPREFFPPESDTGWIKEQGRLVRWRIQTVVVSPEQIGLCGCWLLILVERWQQLVRRGRVMRESVEYAWYCSSVAPGQYTAAQLLGFIQGHWAAMENGSHYRRDVSLGEDACRIRGHNRAQVMATLRNVVLGLFELRKDRGRTRARSFPSWRRCLTVGQMIRLIIRGP
ncbi:hypothetical protein [Limisphaera sp. 4302-co]|uniref:hypothetical protein n=1 Tax=Limisphaera sp. 4302-co TaxID=3400417 RepID=UPI003C2AFEBB